MSWTTYKIVDTITEEIIYIGCTSNTNQRARMHFNKNTKTKITEYMYNKYKFPKMMFDFKIIESFDNILFAYESEKELIRINKPKCNILTYDIKKNNKENKWNLDMFVDPLVFKKITKEGVQDFIRKFKIN